MRVRRKIDGTKFIIATPDEPEAPKLGVTARYKNFEGIVTNLNPYGAIGHEMHVNIPTDPSKPATSECQPISPTSR